MSGPCPAGPGTFNHPGLLSVCTRCRSQDGARILDSFVCGLSAIVAIIQYLPQIYLTSKLEHTGSLSILTLCVQVPMQIVLALSLASRVNEMLDLDAAGIVIFAGRVAWTDYAFAGSLQCVLTFVGIYFNHIRPRLQEKETYPQITHSTTTLPDELTPLIEGEDVDEVQLSHAIGKTMSGCR